MIDFLSASSISAEWGGPKGSLWDFLWQLILAKELARRFEHGDKSGYTSGFTPNILASMIVADLWLKNVDMVLEDLDVTPKDRRRAETREDKEKAEEQKNRGNDALKIRDYTAAIEHYTKALEIDPGNVIYRSNRSAAFFSAAKYKDAYSDAHIAVRLDSSYTKAWSRLGQAAGKLELWKYAVGYYEAAVLFGGEGATEATRNGLKEAERNHEAQIKAINEEEDEQKQDDLRKTYKEQDYEMTMRELQLHSLVYEPQVEGLLDFAVKMKWPFINEVRDVVEEAYSNLRSGQTLPFHLHDWLFGMTLPGHWFSFKIMSALIACTLSIRDSLGFAPSYDCGLSLPKRSYWRIRSVLGRVLGCLPGVLSIGGWLGPCPAVEFDPPLEDQPRHVRLTTRRLSIMPHKAWEAGDPVNYGEYVDRHEDLRFRYGEEEIESWMAEMREATNWIIPEPPVLQVSTCELKLIRLRKDLSGQPVPGDMAAEKAAYRAQLVFKMDDSQSLVTFKLHTNPVFVTVPPCHDGPKGPHECHRRTLHRYEERNIWTIERLKDHTEEDMEGVEVMIINATGIGAELLARAWCSERGKHAVIRRAGGPCFVCAERAASSCGLGVGVLIWVS
jgi:tetratricopeptide (TPR) repeat protein